jgi:hypothetical protein
MKFAAVMALVMLGLGACGGKQYLYRSLDQVVAQPKAKGCTFTVLDKPPEQAYDPLGVLAPLDIGSSKLATDEAGLRKAAEAQICEAGGDAVVIERTSEGRLVRATVIRWR